MNAAELCNLALGRIGVGASNPIQSLTTDTSEEARACNRAFSPAMQAVLREFPWPFAIASVALAQVTQTVPGWEYAYAYPTGCLFLHALSDDETDPLREPNQAARVPFKLVQATSGESLVIATDLANAWAWYTVDVTNPQFGDALFQDALAWRIAMELALGLKANPGMWQAAADGYRLALSKAVAAAGNEAGRDAMPDSDTITAYGYGYADYTERFTR